MTTSDITRAVYLPTRDYDDNPHICIIDGAAPCLTCALITVLGDDRRAEALEIASRLAHLTDPKPELVWYSVKGCHPGLPGEIVRLVDASNWQEAAEKFLVLTADLGVVYVDSIERLKK
jgi:hypothetical protein